MKITVGPISFDPLLLLRLWWPAALFILLCIGIFLSFDMVLLLLDQIAPDFIVEAWLSLLIVYILLGVAFTYFVARLLRGPFGSEERRRQRRMVILSGVPFYVLWLLCVLEVIAIQLNPNAGAIEMIGAVFAFAIAGIIGFALISYAYVLLVLFFLGRLTTIAYQEKGR